MSETTQGADMMLHWSPRSPYARKVMIAAHERGIEGRIRLVRTPIVSSDPSPVLMADNPLHKMPTLVLDSGQKLYDSCVIAEYFDSLGDGPALFPASGWPRWDALRREALGNGFLDLLITWRLESIKPQAEQSKAYLAAYAIKTTACLEALEAEADPEAPFDIGRVAVGCALGYLEFRFGHLGWRAGRPRLAAFADAFEARPSVLANPIEPDPAAS